MSSQSSRSSTPTSGLSKLPPIITNEADREFLYELNGFIDRELSKINPQSEEQRYLVYKSVFNKVIEHVTAYKILLTSIKKEYEDTIESIRTGQREAVFLQGKLKAMASEPSTLRNYKKRSDELEERITIIRKDNDRLQKELQELKAIRTEKEKKPELKEPEKREVKKDHRRIPGMTLEEATDLPTLHKKNERLERTLKEINISLKTRFLPKTQKLQLKDTLENKVNYRDQLLWQSQVYKARGQKLKIALEAAQAYNRVKPPHQTVGDAVMLAFQLVDILLSVEETEGSKGGPLLPMGVVLVKLCDIGHWEMGKNWLQKLVYILSSRPGEIPGGGLLHKLVSHDEVTPYSQWMELVRRLQTEGHEDLSVQLMAVVTVATSMRLAFQVLRHESDVNKESLD